jgi:hypothetical protein
MEMISLNPNMDVGYPNVFGGFPQSLQANHPYSRIVFRPQQFPYKSFTINYSLIIPPYDII